MVVQAAPFSNDKFHRLGGEYLGAFTEIKANVFNVGNFPGWDCSVDPSFIDPTSTQCLCDCITTDIRPEAPDITLV